MSQPRLEINFDNHGNPDCKKNDIPVEDTRFTNFTHIEQNLEMLKIEIAQNPENEFVNSIYDLFLNQDEYIIKEHLQEEINEILVKDTKQDLITYLLKEVPRGNYLLFHICNAGTERNPQFQIPNISFGGLSLPDRDYYLEDTKYQDGLMSLIKKQLAYFDIHNDSDFIWELEKTIAKSHYTKEEEKEPLKTYHPMTLCAFKKAFQPYFKDIEQVLPSEIYDIRVNNDTLMDTFKLVFDSYNVAQLKLWSIWKLIKNTCPYLHNENELYRNHFAFYMSEINGFDKPKNMHQRAGNFVESYLEDKFSQIYVENYVDKRLFTEFPKFVEKIRASLSNKLQTADWMDEDTRAASLEKLNGMKIKVVSPSKFRDYSEIEISYENILQFIRVYKQWEWTILECEEKMYKLRDPNKWEMSVMTANAYFHPLYNELVFPAGILQPPFYDSNASYGENVGGIGAVIANEMTHGFDDEGSKFDKNGFLYDWWSKETRQNYESIIKKMEDYFTTLKNVDLPINAKSTQEENLADMGGLKIALASCEGNTEDEKDCMISWAKIWSANMRYEYAEQLITLGTNGSPHLQINGVTVPLILWINGILPHVNRYYEIFNIGESDVMYLKSEKRCDLWD